MKYSFLLIHDIFNKTLGICGDESVQIARKTKNKKPKCDISTVILLLKSRNYLNNTFEKKTPN